MSVHYKFKSALDYDTVTFDGLHISVKDLKNAIIQQKRIGKSTDFDLQVTNAQTKEEYDDENTLIPKNTSLLIARIPIAAQSKNKQWEGYGGDSTPPAKLDDGGPISRTADLSCLNAPEDEKIIAMMSQSTQDYDPSNYMKIRGANQMGPVPPNYRCYKCHQTGHWIKDCPLAQGSEPIEIKKSTGIPRSFMVPVEGPQVPGAMMTPNGSYAVPVLDHQAYNKKQTPAPAQETKMEIPEDLVCSICTDLLSDAVMIPCCGNSFCDECIRSCLLESEDHECPDCHEKDISPGTLIPNRFLRTSVANFKNTTGYVKKPVYKQKREPNPATVEPLQRNHTPPPKLEANDAQKTDGEEKTVISEADSTEHSKNEDAPPPGLKEEGPEPAKSSGSSESIPEGPPGVSPRASPKAQVITNRMNYTRESKSRHHKRDREDRSPKKHHRSRKTSPNFNENGRNQEDRSGTPTIDEPGSGGYSAERLFNAPPGTIPPIISGMNPMQGPPPNIPGQFPPNAPPIGQFPPTQGPPPNFRLPPPGTAPPFIPGFPGPPRPMFDPARPPMSGPPPNFNPNFPPGSRTHHGRDYPRGRLRDRTPPGVIDDPLAAFNRMLREKDERERRNKARNIRRSYSRSRSRSYSRSPPLRRKRSRSPRRRGSRSRSRSFSMSRSRSRSYSGGSLRGSPYRHNSPPRRSPPPLPPPRRGNSRFRSPIRSPTRRHDRNRDRDFDHDRDYTREDRPFREKDRRDRDNRSRDRERYFDGFDDRRQGGRVGGQWGPGQRGGPPPAEAFYPDMQHGFSNRYPPRDYQQQNMPPNIPPVGMPPMHIPPQRRFDDIAPPGVEEPPVPGLEASPTFDRYNQKPPEIKTERNGSPREERREEKKPVEKRDDRHSDRKRRHDKRSSRTPEKPAKTTSPRKKSKSKDRDSPEKYKKRRRGDSQERDDHEKKKDHSDDEKAKKSKDKKKKREKKDSEKKKKKEKKEKHKKEDKEKKVKDEFKQVIIRTKGDSSVEKEVVRKSIEEREKRELTPKQRVRVEEEETTPEKIITPKAELYDDVLVEDIDTSVMETYGKVQEPAEIAHVEDKIPVEIEEPEEGEISNTYEDESEKDVLELHLSDMDLKAELDKSEMLAPLPEKSKWEVEEEGSYQSSPKDSLKSDSKSDKSGKVTNEVLKRAENAIFAKAINAIRPIEIKKISLDRVKLYSGEREVEKADNNKIQITVPVVTETKPPAPVRLSVKDRLGVKVDDTDRVVKVSRNRSRSLSPFSRRGDGGRNHPLNERRVEINRNRRSRSRHNRDNSRDRHRNRDNRRDHRDNRHDDSRRTDRRAERSKHREKSERRERSKSTAKAQERKKRSKSRSPSIEEQKTKKKDKKHKKEKSKKHKDEEVDKEGKIDKTEELKLKPTTEKRKATIDESSFEPDYDLESESEKDDEKNAEIKKDAEEKIDVKEEGKRETSSSDSESSSSSEEERKRKKHKKHRKRKRKESTSSSSDSDSESSEEEKQKRKKHKKKQKKRKKSKHK